MEQALYGPDGFYRVGAGPSAHFRTSIHASPLFAEAVVRLLREVDEALGRPRNIALVDVGAGRGELLEAVHARLLGSGRADFADGASPADPANRDNPADGAAGTESPAESPAESLAERLSLTAVEVAPRPDNLTSCIEWRNELPSHLTGLLIANEWLDNVPCDVAEAKADRWRIVEVAPDGTERLGSEPGPDQVAWLSAWWPTPDTPDATPFRAEIGLSRDAAWRDAVAALDRGVAIAIDYAHDRASRPPFGTLTGYANGRQVTPIPDGSCDITAHVALDACAAAAAADTASDTEWVVLSTQRAVFHSLGITGGRPDLALASTDPRGYLRALSQASSAAELTDPHGLGGFGWLAQGVGVPTLPSLTTVARPPLTSL